MRSSVVIFLVALLLVPGFTYAQAQSAEERAALQAQLDQIEKDIANNKGTLSELQVKRTSLERDIAILDNKIATAQLQIRQTDLTLRQLQTNINEKLSSIKEIDASVARSQASLAQIIRRTNEIDDMSLAEIALGNSLSNLFQEIDDFQSVQKEMDKAFKEMADLRADMSDRKEALEEKEDEAEKVRIAQVAARQAVQRDEKEKQNILSATKGAEKTYQQIISEKQKQADAIRAALFGLRDTGAISFGVAYEYAKAASQATGVRAALILAILTQESDLGTNVGSCYVTNLVTGGGVGKNTGRTFANVMKAPRDTDPFKNITEILGKDWSSTPVSCPQSAGYGGAMGPAQFIPSTWVLYVDRLKGITGESYPNPWNARTAVAATGLLMKDNGADEGTRTAERRAALKYFAGGNWSKAANAPYGDGVMAHADQIQAEINILEGK